MIAQCKAEKARDGARKSERLKKRRGLEAGKFEARGRIKLNRACHEQRVAVTRLRRSVLTLTLKGSGCKKIEGARSEKDITRVSGTLSTGSIPVGRTSQGDHLHWGTRFSLRCAPAITSTHHCRLDG